MVYFTRSCFALHTVVMRHQDTYMLWISCTVWATYEIKAAFNYKNDVESE